MTSCGSTRITRLDIEHCSTEGRNLVPMGVNSGSSSSTYYDVSSNRVVNGTTNSRNLICGKSQDKYDVCLSQKLKVSGIIVNEYNSGSKVRELLTGFGYILYIIPGVLGAFYNTHVNNEKMELVSRIRNEAFEYCAKYKPEIETL